jgi:hypothetical protein
MRKLVVFVLACMLAGCPGSPSGQERLLSKNPPSPIPVKPFTFGQPQIVLLATGGGNGVLEMCDCSGPMPGGLSRRSGLVLSYRAAFPNVVLIDTGDAFWRSGDHPANEFILHGFNQIGYDAMVLGDQEWMASGSRVHSLFAPGKMQYLSTTVSEASAPQGQPPLATVKVVKREFPKGKIAILSDLRPQWNLLWSSQQTARLDFAKRGELAAQVDQLHKEGYIVAVVCHGDDEALKQTAGQCAADFFLHGHKSRVQDKLLNIDGRPVVNVKGSEVVAVLGIQVKDDGKLANLEYRLEKVEKPWPIDDRLLQSYKDYSKVSMQAAMATQTKPGLEYAGSARCGHCHQAIYENWKKTAHSHAYETLVRVKRTDDPACISCHTSGFGTTKGFSTIQKTPELVNVNCQDCHRVDFTRHAKNHVTPPPITEATCRTCHTDVTAPKFNFEIHRSKIRCPASGIH